MDADTYLQNIVLANTPPNPVYDINQKMKELEVHISPWANGWRYQIKPHGSNAKGTAIMGSSDMDFFISLEPRVSDYNTYQQVYETLRNRFRGAGYSPREQDVSIGINHGGLKVDLVAGVQQGMLSSDHHIRKRKAQTWTKTNIDEQIKYVAGSGRVFDISLVKIWRNLRGLDFPSFYLELSVINALKPTGLLMGSPSKNFIAIMNYLSGDFLTATIKDPGNESNEVSDDLTIVEKQAIRDAAIATLKSNWEQAVW
jgi:hypothetical protein